MNIRRWGFPGRNRVPRITETHPDRIYTKTVKMQEE